MISGVGSRPVRGVLFDIDDTLVDLRVAMRAGLDASLIHLVPSGVSGEAFEDVFAAFVRDPNGYYVAFLAGELAFDEQRKRRVVAALAQAGIAVDPGVAELEAWDRVYRLRGAENWGPSAGVIDMLDELDRLGIPYGAVSNNTYARQREKLDRSGLARVTHLVGVDTVGVAKPAPEMFLEGCRLLGRRPAEVMFVGDNWEADVLGAQAAGLRGVWFNPAEHAEGPPAAEAELIAERITDARQLLKLPGLIG